MMIELPIFLMKIIKNMYYFILKLSFFKFTFIGLYKQKCETIFNLIY